MWRQDGFTMVELMVVAAIVAILAVVATPAYINYVNRTKQGEAYSKLLTARLEQEEYYADNGQYAAAIQCLPSFVAAANTSCLSNCGNCGANSSNDGYYTFTVNPSNFALTNGSTPGYYQVIATRRIYSYAATDMLTISAITNNPVVQNTAALKFSLFQWLFH